MKIKLETLQHQTDALAAIDKSFPGMDTMSNDPNANYIYANPYFYVLHRVEQLIFQFHHHFQLALP